MYACIPVMYEHLLRNLAVILIRCAQALLQNEISGLNGFFVTQPVKIYCIVYKK